MPKEKKVKKFLKKKISLKVAPFIKDVAPGKNLKNYTYVYSEL